MYLIYILFSRGAISRTLGHETYHYVETESPHQAKEISDFVIDTLTKLKGDEWVQKMYADYESKGYDTLEKQKSELVADQMFEVFANERAVKEFAVKDESLFQKVANHIKELLNEIKNIYKKLVASGNYEDIAAWQSDMEALDKLNNMMLDALAEIEHTNSQTQKNTSDEVKIIPSSVRFSDKQRAELFEKTYIEPVDIVQEHISQTDVEALQSKYKKDAKAVIESLIEKFESDGKTLYKKYSNDNIDLEFYFGSRRMSESLNKQNKNYYYFAQMLLNLEELVTNAVPIESHSDKYKSTRRQDNSLKQTYVLMSALKESKNSYVPIQFEIKEFIDKQNSLYIAIALNKIEVDVSGQTSDKGIGENNPRSTSKISIADIIRNINPVDASFLKYAPDDLLNAEQKEAKEKALIEEHNKIEKYRAEADETSKSTTKFSTKRNVEEQKQNQLDIINETNPAPNTYSTWIRTVDDIKTLAETLEDEDWDYEEFNPDLTRTDIQNAIESGEITVYSSYPIKNGVFVSPSRMEAESYSGNGKIYEKTVDINDVAWIDPTQGQYAKVIPLSQRFDASEDDIRFSSKRAEITAKNTNELTENDVKQFMKDAINGNLHEGTYFPARRNTPKILIESALNKNGDTIENLPIIIQVKKATAHGISPEDMIAIVKAMDDPQYIIYQEDNDRYVEVVKYDASTGSKAVAVLEIGGNKDTPYLNGFEGGSYHTLVTAFKPDAGYVSDTLLNKKSNTVIYKKKGNSQRTSGSTVPSVLNELPFADSITENGNNVNGDNKFSTKREPSISEDASDYILDTKEYQQIIDIVNQRYNLTNKKKLSPKAIDRLAGSLLAKSKSKYDKGALTERLSALFDYMANSDELVWEDVMKTSAEIAHDILSKSSTLDRSMQNMVNYYQDKHITVII